VINGEFAFIATIEVVMTMMMMMMMMMMMAIRLVMEGFTFVAKSLVLESYLPG